MPLLRRANKLRVPIVYNTSGYERVEAVRELGASTVDIWLTDFKYGNAALGKSFPMWMTILLLLVLHYKK